MKDARGTGLVKPDGVVAFDDRPKFLAQLKELENETVTVHVFVGVTRKARGYYRAEVLPKIAEQIGHDVDFTHELLKRKFNPIEVSCINRKTGEDESYTIGGSFEDCGRAVFAEKLDRVVWWGRDFLGANIEEPTPAQERALRGEASCKERSTISRLRSPQPSRRGSVSTRRIGSKPMLQPRTA